jgi:hypothetical protein
VLHPLPSEEEINRKRQEKEKQAQFIRQFFGEDITLPQTKDLAQKLNDHILMFEGIAWRQNRAERLIEINPLRNISNIYGSETPLHFSNNQ